MLQHGRIRCNGAIHDWPQKENPAGQDRLDDPGSIWPSLFLRAAATSRILFACPETAGDKAMAIPVVNGAKLLCTMGTAPCTFIVPPVNKVMMEGAPAANIMDNVPMKNITGFGNCLSLANPTVASATSAAMGVLTPMPCVPVIPAPWAPGSATLTIGKLPALNNSSKCMCAFAGSISVVDPGAKKETIP
jgi:hypothetical protein